jgi:lipopolysaccharide transport system permease protein
MAVFTLFFGRLAKLPSDGVPYAVFALAALVPWNYFAGAVSYASGSLVASQLLIRKVFFPRILIPLAAVISGLVDLCFGVLLLVCVLLAFGMSLTARAWWIIPFTLLAVINAAGIALFLSSLNVRYRDVHHSIPFVLQIWLFATPVAYPSSMLSERWRVVYGLNPMVGVVEGYRWALLGTDSSLAALPVSVAVGLLLLITGTLFFSSQEDDFADVV